MFVAAATGDATGDADANPDVDGDVVDVDADVDGDVDGDADGWQWRSKVKVEHEGGMRRVSQRSSKI